MNRFLIPVFASVFVLISIGLSYDAFAQSGDKCIWNSQNSVITCNVVPKTGETVSLILPPLILNEPGDACQITFESVTHDTKRTGTIHRALVECESGAQFYIGFLDYRVSGKISEHELQEPTIDPISEPVGTFYTITDPQGRIQQGDVVIFYEEGTDPVDGVTNTNVSISSDGKTLTGQVPFGVSVDVQNYVSVTEQGAYTPRFNDLGFFVTLS